jgi:RNA polymerase sigma-70 factor (ECF subfamily)
MIALADFPRPHDYSSMATGTGSSDQLELVALAAEGDPAAQTHFIALLGRRVRTISLAILGHPEDAEDAAQSILIELLQSAPSYRGGSLNAWADRIAVRTAARHARKRRVRAAQVDPELSPDALAMGPTSTPTSIEHSIPRPIVAYLAELPEARRTALVLRHVLGYSISEIAELTETSPNTVKDRLLQARRQVRRSVRRELASTIGGVS